MATRLEELEERLAALEGEGGYGAYGEEAYAPSEEAGYGAYGEEAYAPSEEEMAGALEEAFEGMSEEEIGAFSDTMDALETGQLRLEDLTPEEMGRFSRFLRKVAGVFKRVRRVVKPIWRVAKPVLSRRFPWMRYLPFEEEMAAPSSRMRQRCPPGYRTVPVQWRCRPSYMPSYRSPMRPSWRATQPPVRR
jgi:hypothetical protein